jgi:hypothetical protein
MKTNLPAIRTLSLVLAVALVVACEKAPVVTPTPTPTAKPSPTPPDPNDPAEVKHRFLQTINEAVERAGPGLKKPRPRLEGFPEVEGAAFSAEYAGQFAYDITKTDSIVTPYRGTVSWHMRWYYKANERPIAMTFDAHYAYQEGKWIIKDLSRSYPEGQSPASEYIDLFR